MFHVILPSIICANHLYCVTLDHAFMVGSTLYRQEMILFDSMICMHPWHLIIIELFGDSLWRCRFLGGASCGSSPHLRCFDVFRDTRSLEVRKFESSRCTWALCCQKGLAPWPHGTSRNSDRILSRFMMFHDGCHMLSWCLLHVVSTCFNVSQFCCFFSNFLMITMIRVEQQLNKSEPTGEVLEGFGSR